MKKKLYSAILASIMVIGSICGVAIPVYAKEETKIIEVIRMFCRTAMTLIFTS